MASEIKMTNPYNSPSKTNAGKLPILIEVGADEADKGNFSYDYLISTRPIVISKSAIIIFVVGVILAMGAWSVVMDKIAPGVKVVETKEIVKRPIWYPAAMFSAIFSVPFLLLFYRHRKNIQNPTGMRCRNCKNPITIVNVHLILESGECNKCKERLIKDI